MASLQQIFGWFARGLFPTEDQYRQTYSSFWHKNERLPQTQILGLNDALNDKASKDDLANATTKFKGYHTTLVKLQNEYPQAQNKKDFFAWVGSPYPGTVYKVFADGGAWTYTGEVPPVSEVDLTEYAKKEDIVNELGDNDKKAIAQKVVTLALNDKVNISDLPQDENVGKVVLYDCDFTGHVQVKGDTNTAWYANPESKITQSGILKDIIIKSYASGTVYIRAFKVLSPTSFSLIHEFAAINITTGENTYTVNDNFDLPQDTYIALKFSNINCASGNGGYPKMGYRLLDNMTGAISEVRLSYKFHVEIQGSGSGVAKDILTETKADILFVKQETSLPIVMSYKGESSASVDLAANAVYSPNHQYIALGGSVTPHSGDVCYTETYIEIFGGQEYLITNVPLFAGAFYDKNKNFIADISGIQGEALADVIVKAPSNAVYVRLNASPNIRNSVFAYPVTENIDVEIKINESQILTRAQTLELLGDNSGILLGKTVGWYGTSIPAGDPHQDEQNKSSYANIVVQSLGGKILNRCHPGGVLTTIRANDAGSFLSSNGIKNYKKDMLDLIGTADEPDYFIFDYGVNDRNLDGNMFKSENWNFDSVDTRNYIGAFNFVMKELYAKKIDAKVIIVTHYSNDHADTNVPTLNYFADVNKTLIALAEYWNIPCIKMHHLSGWVYRNGVDTITPNCPDGIHPASDATYKSVNYLAGILKKQLPLVLNG